LYSLYSRNEDKELKQYLEARLGTVVSIDYANGDIYKADALLIIESEDLSLEQRTFMTTARERHIPVYVVVLVHESWAPVTDSNKFASIEDFIEFYAAGHK
jgi:hypothetical protein